MSLAAAGRNLDVAPPFEAALVAMRLGSAIPTASVSPSCDLSADVKTGGARSTSKPHRDQRRLKRRRDIEISTRGTRLISENVGAAMEMAQMKQLEGMEVTRVFLHSNSRSEIVFLT